MWQTQSVGPVRTAHISVLLTVNIVSHNPAQNSSDNILSEPRMLSSGEERESATATHLAADNYLQHN